MKILGKKRRKKKQKELIRKNGDLKASVWEAYLIYSFLLRRKNYCF
jgi:hypothetical protein